MFNGYEYEIKYESDVLSILRGQELCIEVEIVLDYRIDSDYDLAEFEITHLTSETGEDLLPLYESNAEFRVEVNKNVHADKDEMVAMAI